MARLRNDGNLVRARSDKRKRTNVPDCTAAKPRPGCSILTNSRQQATMTNWYKQNVYDPGDNKIGEVMDVLVDREGKITALIIGVGGFLGIGEKDVVVPFNAVQLTKRTTRRTS